ncbi:MAG: DsrE family protein [Gammaproteobacteria bacterium]|nr:DsrE family protein [Gammaproteobacteria bacterium]
MKILTRMLQIVVLAVSGLNPLYAADYQHPEVNRLLQATETPDGVVFEISSWDKNSWQWAAPLISSLHRQLKDKFPAIDVTIVSHGGEQFQLTRQRQQEQPQAIAQLTELVSEGVNLHVCGTHSSWKNVDPSEYIEIVDVAGSAPAQINDYIKLGYQHIFIQKPL